MSEDRTPPAEAVANGHDLVWDPPWPGRAWWRCRTCRAVAIRSWGSVTGAAMTDLCTEVPTAAGEP